MASAMYSPMHGSSIQFGQCQGTKKNGDRCGNHGHSIFGEHADYWCPWHQSQQPNYLPSAWERNRSREKAQQ